MIKTSYNLKLFRFIPFIFKVLGFFFKLSSSVFLVTFLVLSLGCFTLFFFEQAKMEYYIYQRCFKTHKACREETPKQLQCQVFDDKNNTAKKTKKRNNNKKTTR